MIAGIPINGWFWGVLVIAATVFKLKNPLISSNKESSDVDDDEDEGYLVLYQEI